MTILSQTAALTTMTDIPSSTSSQNRSDPMRDLEIIRYTICHPSDARPQKLVTSTQTWWWTQYGR